MAAIAENKTGEKKKKKEVMLVTGAGQISMAIARRIGFGKKIILGDKNIENANIIKAPAIIAEIWYTFRGHPAPGKVYE